MKGSYPNIDGTYIICVVNLGVGHGKVMVLKGTRGLREEEETRQSVRRMLMEQETYCDTTLTDDQRMLVLSPRQACQQ